MSATLQQIEAERQQAQRVLTEAHNELQRKRRARTAALGDPAQAAHVATLDGEIKALMATIKTLEARRANATNRYHNRVAFEGLKAKQERGRRGMN